MIIDAHTHIYPDHVAEKALQTLIKNTRGELNVYTNGRTDDLLASMNTAGVDLSVVLTIATKPGHGKGILQWIREQKEKKSRLIYFASAHPYDHNYKDLLKEIKEEGIQGIKLHPGYQNFPVDSPEAYKVYEEAFKNDLVLYFHSGYDMGLPDCDFTTIERFANVLKDFSGSKIVLAHGGDCREWDKVLELLGDKKCYYDIAFVLEDMMQDEHAKALYRQNEDYFIFGTDSPWREQKSYVDLIKNSNFLSNEQKNKLFCKNILKLIKIPA